MTSMSRVYAARTVFVYLKTLTRTSRGLGLKREWILPRPFLQLQSFCSERLWYDLDYIAFKQCLGKEDIQLIDVREPYEYQAGKIADAINIPCTTCHIIFHRNAASLTEFRSRMCGASSKDAR